MRREPGFDDRMLVRCVAVHNEDDIELRSDIPLDVIEERDKFDVSMSRQAQRSIDLPLSVLSVAKSVSFPPARSPSLKYDTL